MSQQQLEAVIARFGAMKSQWSATVSLERMRTDLDELHASYVPPFAFDTQPVTMGGVDCEWVAVPESSPDRTLLYFHGGGFATGSIRATRNLAAFLAHAAQAHVLVVGYRLAPEHPFPAPLEDAEAVYDALLASGFDASRLALGGDSAGGGLVLALLASRARYGLPLPAAAVLLTPWIDMRCDAGSYDTLKDRDPIAGREMAQMMAQTYLGTAGRAEDPRATPILGDFTGFPPLLIHAAGRDVFLDDAHAVQARAVAAGVEARCEVHPDMIHQWQLYAGALDEGRASVDTIGRFLRHGIP